ncbi:hypothetical protein OPV22_011576 [Ensete ventricosum]|uniref:AT-hook motif nuclear-localized protein n=1 Tax=Ensete ventricosum TaxID=4639 RepID=A0AAV8PZ18_ENSVE|nr:hypothetical protein OPV22_011576 [Ensete ventricosum]
MLPIYFSPENYIQHLAGFLPGFLYISALPGSFLRNSWDKDGTLMLRVLRVYALSFTSRVFMLVRGELSILPLKLSSKSLLCFPFNKNLGLGFFFFLLRAVLSVELRRWFFSRDPTKKARGRPSGSGKKQQMAALGSAGIGFTPHVITVKTGEDVSSKIMSFCQHGPRAVCILSANGAISNVTLRQAATSGGTVTYEGRFEILSLSGSFLLSESGGQRSRTGGLSVSLAGTDGRVLGGGVAGQLTAASPVQVIVGSFIADGRKEKKTLEPMSAPGKPVPAGTSGPSSPPSRGTLSESSGGPGSPLNQSTGTYNNNIDQQGLSSIPWK